ncbi:MAG TPA: hypothetical protein VEX43_10090 [Chthoniobacterales bacterium]|nr:hypothetical protein [Chthoniobacterales bacterium]
MKLLRFVKIMAISLISAGVSLSRGGPAEPEVDASWYRVLNLSAPVNPRFEPFEITGIGSAEGNHLVGEFRFFNYKEGDKSPPTVTIKGSRKSDGTFWPQVEAQVANEIDSQWRTIGNPPTPGEITSLIIASKPAKEEFYVDLDIFRPMIGKVKYGKVILETGDSAIFEINDLLPPKTDVDKRAEKDGR